MLNPDTVAYMPFLQAALAFLILAEAIYLVRRRKRRYPWREAATTLVIGTGALVTSRLAIALLIGPLFEFLWQARIATIPMSAAWAWLLLFILTEFTTYWSHRSTHRVRWWWATHSVHHSSQSLNFTVLFRSGWTDVLSGYFVLWAPLVLIGYEPAAVFAMLSVSLLYPAWLHTETIRAFTSPIGRIFSYVFNTPSHHRVHHATNAPYLDRNFGSILILFDRIFGTFAAERPDLPCRYGLVDQIESMSPLRIVFNEWIKIAADLGKARNLRDILGSCFGPPGWRQDRPSSVRGRQEKDSGTPAAYLRPNSRSMSASLSST